MSVNKKIDTWSRIPSTSVLINKGHQPFVLFCLNKLIIGTLPSVFSMSKVHCLTVLAPLGNRFKSKVIAPRKSSLEKWSASHTWSVSLERWQSYYIMDLKATDSTKKYVQGITYICTEQIFDSRLLMYFRSLYSTSLRFFWHLLLPNGQLFEAQWVFEVSLKIEK